MLVNRSSDRFCTRGMIHTKIHLINPRCPRPSILTSAESWLRTPFDDKMCLWLRHEKIEKLCAVMGNELPEDRDPSYELTTDNAKKILAIHMRFRWAMDVYCANHVAVLYTRQTFIVMTYQWCYKFSQLLRVTWTLCWQKWWWVFVYVILANNWCPGHLLLK